MEVLNVLVADLSHTSAFFLRHLLRAQGHRVSIAFSGREALDKVSTGLFDLVLADAHPFATATEDLLGGVQELVPALPTVLVTDLAGAERCAIPNCFGVVGKPLRANELRASLALAQQHLIGMRDKRQHVRRTVDLPVELSIGHRRVQARAINLSLGGVQVDTGEGDAWSILSLAGGNLRARLALGGDGATLELPARLAYVDGADGAPEHVGLAFAGVGRAERLRLTAFLTAA